ncbi:Regulator of sirC expression, contains transglutaminase-like and TPR domains [Tistlia consotensis]|uniref:Regulator of sirC expression, contains transglutaminase-like and TPR domains n=1 Tax=Tistlia consotensis USBA 355 TaxID=560819 RepID=A0A1Y6BFP0_9PROT|nr:transglutaminase-like domain-containing protein [Tistlia consotensis]SMF08730.1 Regulator of sirC expression, contains transglutaminase-like and TPR domains [Tistlia consotensis USBA 355]SNR35215.1 Regulator of sirC expression, contains transglutaminase-like and TPR domains [Tistlia consotensis]
MSWSPASGRDELERRLRRVGGQDDREIDLAGTALLLAALEAPQQPIERYSHHLSLLARDTADLGGEAAGAGDLEARAAALRAVLVGRYEYAGDEETYDDLQNANLMRVIDRRRGLPVALAILWLHAARAQGWEAEGVNFPGHFLIRLQCGSRRLILDPFRSGDPLGPQALRQLLKAVRGEAAELAPEHYAACGNREILLRLQNNIKVRRLREGALVRALEAVESMLLLDPAEGPLWREAGLLHMRLDNLRAAIFAFDNFLELAAGDPRRGEVATLLARLRARLN